MLTARGCSVVVVVAIWPFGGYGTSGSKVPDAAGVDAAPDAAGVDTAPDVAADLGNQSDGAPADVASERGGGDVAGSDGGGADGGDGGADPCRPPCRARIYGGCPPEGTCTYSTGVTCYSNGVTATTLPPGGTTIQTRSKNGVVCATLDAIYVWRDPNGAPLGTVTLNGDGSATLTCTGEAPVTVPASCGIPCQRRNVPPVMRAGIRSHGEPAYPSAGRAFLSQSDRRSSSLASCALESALSIM